MGAAEEACLPWVISQCLLPATKSRVVFLRSTTASQAGAPWGAKESAGGQQERASPARSSRDQLAY